MHCDNPAIAPPSGRHGVFAMRRGWVLGRRALAALVAGGVLAGLSAGAWAGKAHVHGAARLDIAVEPTRITLFLETPLENLLGFERAPRTDAERAAADAMLARLRAFDGLLRVDGAAGCKPGAVRIDVPALAQGGAAPDKDKDGHADLEAQFEFVCAAGTKAGFVEVGLFDAFPRLARIELQLVGPRGQLKATLRRPNSRVALVR